MKARWKDSWREMLRTFSRFLALFGIIFLGTGFFVGIRGASPDMKDTAAAYFKAHHLEDIGIQSSWGLDDEDLKAAQKVADIDIDPYRTVDLEGESHDMLVRFYPNFNQSAKSNHFDVVQGRLPKAKDEVAVDAGLLDRHLPADILKQTLRFKQDNTDEEAPHLTQTEFKVVGVVNSPMMIDRTQRGATNVGKGSLDGFLVVDPDVLAGERYTGFAVHVPKADDYKAYSEPYEQAVDEKVKALKTALADRPQAVYTDIKKEMTDKIEEGDKKLQDAKNKLKKEEKKLKDAREAWQEGQDQLTAQKEQVASQLPPGVTLEEIGLSAQFAPMEAELKAKDKKLTEGEKEFKAEKKKADQKIKDQEEQLAEAKEERDDLKAPTYKIEDREHFPSYGEFEDNADRIQGIGNVFPLVFFLVAALVSFTTMTRMVEEHREQIGTYKALGYGAQQIAQKFLLYALMACLLGSFTGILFGNYFFPWIIITAYKMLYTIGETQYGFHGFDIALAMGIALLTTVGPALAMTWQSLREAAAKLMRPKPPKKGQHIALEHWRWFWQKLSFKQKITMRNLFRYKGRNSMTVIGIMGCTALMLTGFGISDSISGLADVQFQDLDHRDAIVQYQPQIKEKAREDLTKKLADQPEIEEAVSTYSKQYETTAANVNRQQVSLTVACSPGINHLLAMKDLESGQPKDLGEEDVFINQKLAPLLNIQTGDDLELEDEDGETLKVKVTGVFENYLLHYVVMKQKHYEELTGEKIEPNTSQIRLTAAGQKKRDSLLEDLLGLDEVAGVMDLKSLNRQFDDTIETLNIVVWALIIAAAALAFIVLYCLTDINVSERIRELSTIKVLGAFPLEVTLYIFRETILLTLIGIGFGFAFGLGLTAYILKTVEIDMMVFPLAIHGISYAYAAGLTLLFTLLVLTIMHFKLKQVDMVEALKGVE